jgi:hypothetical protein
MTYDLLTALARTFPHLNLASDKIFPNDEAGTMCRQNDRRRLYSDMHFEGPAGDAGIDVRRGGIRYHRVNDLTVSASKNRNYKRTTYHLPV